MLEALNSYYTFRNHPILKKIENYFISRNVNKLTLDLLKNNVLFIYPKIISFSFTRNPKWKDTFEDQRRDSDYGLSKIIDSESKDEILYRKEAYLTFFKYLFNYIEEYKENPIIITDLRKTTTFDKSILISTLKEIITNYFGILILAPDDLHEEMEKLREQIQLTNFQIFFDEKNLFNFIDDFVEIEENVLSLALPEKLTVLSFSNFLKSCDFYSSIKNKFLINLNFEKTYYINSFALFLLNNFIRTVSPKYGVRWKFSNWETKKKLSAKLTEFRTFKVNSFFQNIDYYSIDSSNQNLRRMGTYLFNERTRSALNEKFNDFLSNIVDMFPDYLNQRASITYDSPFKSYKATTRRLTYQSYIRMIVRELTENATTHSLGTGYFAAELNNYVIYIYIGDCGIGLRKGILKNYDLSDIIKTDSDSVSSLFILDKYVDRRTDKGKFNRGAGFGLKDTSNNIFRLNGKVMYRSMNYFASYMNPVRKANLPPSVFESYTNIKGTQYMIVIPLSIVATNSLPATSKDFLELEA